MQDPWRHMGRASGVRRSRPDGPPKGALLAPLLLAFALLTAQAPAQAAEAEPPALPKPPSLADELARISGLEGVVVKGIERTKEAPARAGEGSLKERIKALLSDFNYVMFQSPEGAIEVVITSSRARPPAPSVPETVRYAAQPLAQSPIGSAEGARIERTGALAPLHDVPLDGARISSAFGMRQHPILGYSMMHRGIDYAAPLGAPVYAAASGVIVEAGRNGAYGNYVRIRHDLTYQSAYAHLSGFAEGLTEGAFVRAGEVIGTVGSTGRSTGPHLHYEVLVKGERVDPESVELPTGGLLLAAFRRASD